ncbi:MAG: type ISP restriction/modification enzyme [Longimonas sp.]|uniref:type ISP restriction/modification enzyme n=1 Tax=Longimonas sp. TaxID=2039626 RepID=UPI0039760546
MSGVDTGTIREELRPLGQPEHTDPGRSLRTSDFAVTGGWGYLAHHGATMPGGGTKEKRSYTPDEEAALPTGIRAQWGASTFDIYWNEDCRWANVPERVWDYTLGGYPVIKKWLSYREKKVLGRALTFDEIRHVQHMTCRIAALLRLEPAWTPATTR